MWGAAALAGGLFVLCTAAPGVAGAQPYRMNGLGGATAEKPRVEFRIEDPGIAESSGLAASRKHKGIVYTHNDSGGAARFYALDRKGRTRATFTVGGAESRDWEAMAAAGGYLYFGDIGDNGGVWDSISIYQVKEPDVVRDGTVQATRFRFRYKKGGPRDAETLLVHPSNGRIYIADKSFSGSLYAAPKRLRTDRINKLRRVADAPPLATDGAFAPDGSSFVIRTYFSARLYREVGDEDPITTDMPRARQAESITYTADGKALLTGAEGANSKVWRVPLPTGESPSSTPTPDDIPTPGPSTASSPAEDSPSFALSGKAVAAWVAMGAGAIGIIIWLARSTR